MFGAHPSIRSKAAAVSSLLSWGKEESKGKETDAQKTSIRGSSTPENLTMVDKFPMEIIFERLRESRLLAPSRRRRESHATS